MSAEAWEVRVHWKPEPGVTCPESTVYPAEDENRALDAAVSVLDGCRHHRALVKAVKAEIRPAGGEWRIVAAGHIRSYL